MSSAARKQRITTSDRIDPDKPAAIVINGRFKGLTHFCELTGFPTSTAHYWLTQGTIPPRLRNGDACQSHILAVAAANEIAMDPADFVERPANDQCSSGCHLPPANPDERAPSPPTVRFPPEGGDGAHPEIASGQ